MDSVGNDTETAKQTFLLNLRQAATLRNLLSTFQRLRLEVQFIIIASFVVVALMIALAVWTTNRLEKTVFNSVGSLGAAYLQTFVAPLISEEDIKRGVLPPFVEDKLKQLLGTSALGQHVHELKIWGPDGSLMYSTSGKEIDEEVVFEELQRALAGEIVVSRTMIEKHEYTGDEQRGMYIEVYAPLVRNEAGKVLLVGEFYERPDFLVGELSTAWRETISIVLLVSVPMLALLFLIVRSGSLLIDRQHAAIRHSLRRALELSNQNRRLRGAAETARLEAGKLNEMILDQIGTDLHDGPVQLLTLLKLRLSDMATQPIGGQSADPVRRQDIDKLVSTVTTALEELRNISTDLVLPELDDMSLSDTIQLAVRRHVDVIGREIDVVGLIASQTVDPHLNICVYRFIQEALMNSERHAPGNRQHLRYGTRHNRLFITVADVGTAPSTTVSVRSTGRTGLGTITQKRRIRAFGGRMRTIRRASGTVVTAVLTLDHSGGSFDRH
ncbi:ATP-binding protein [Ensifer sp. T173]|uniref:ATP-binding protein n=1 Tax=Ensifer canadensis TaxID=555315 RepID=A0AAW4FVL5_9HYPH|nr:histidine kinase [Ensifer canadensis]MBM3095457.1 ATP-binding protein [Ensifer canadensis]UBI74648.1 ATP-binding protein [Ensifer canadensis]